MQVQEIIDQRMELADAIYQHLPTTVTKRGQSGIVSGTSRTPTPTEGDHAGT